MKNIIPGGIGLTIGLVISFIALCMQVYVDTNMIGEELTCDARYVGATYKGKVLAQKGNYIYLSGTESVWLDCTVFEDEVTEDSPLCGSIQSFSGPIDMESYNCYKGDKDIQGKLEAYMRQEEDAKAEEEKYRTCEISMDTLIAAHDACVGSTYECRKRNIKYYLKDKCPRATIK